MKKLLFVFGTRPEAIKMAPLIAECKRREAFETVVCVTGQHRQMLDPVLEAFGIVPDHDLNIMKDRQDLFDITTAVLEGVRRVCSLEKPDLVLVHGDTSTTFGAALAAFYMQIPVGHVEAGLRTYDMENPYPEEFNRSAVGMISTYNFAPTPLAAENLLREGKRPDRVFVTGNTVV
ncbi:MAG: UDP-N-acetylglucosamine 2-epimerase (non-hydrolyzing), partial [Lachnospiraceae bacterium]|nr:UDP-N-acetylglucosamine 2-epimerase (non-hydrolyzing) [Lachnospiraceae bacterium]